MSAFTGFPQRGTIQVLSPSVSLSLSFFFFFGLFRAAPTEYGNSQARGQIRATAASLHYSHSNAGSTLCLQPTRKLQALRDP